MIRCDRSIAVFLLLGLSGCKVTERFRERPLTSTPTPALAPSPVETLARENRELLAEMIRVVFREDQIEDPGSFEELSRSLNQGASLEGIYRGIVMGTRYRALESKSKGASPQELRAFASEMAELQLAMRNPTLFDETSKRAPEIEFPGGDASSSAPAAPATTPPSPARKKDRAAIEAELLRVFIGASSFTLKRVLGEEALRKFDEDSSDSAGISQWYAGLVLRLIARGLDAGLELRNRSDFGFHQKFAERMARDRVKWEVLNRYHRYLNSVALRSP